jgi:hypothetical protein
MRQAQNRSDGQCTPMRLLQGWMKKRRKGVIETSPSQKNSQTWKMMMMMTMTNDDYDHRP